MSRNISAAMISALSGGSVTPVFFAKFEFPSNAPTSHVHFWTGLGSLNWNGDTYAGLGDLRGIQFPQENSAGATGGVTFSLSGIPSENTSLSLNENYQNSACFVWLGALDDSGAIIADPYLMFSGLMDVMQMNDDGTTADITLNAEGFAFGVGPSGARYTDEDQQRAYPGDIGLEFVSGLHAAQVFWGVKDPNVKVWVPPAIDGISGDYDEDGYLIP